MHQSVLYELKTVFFLLYEVVLYCYIDKRGVLRGVVA